MLVFATSEKGGTGRSVTSSNVVYRSALRGADSCYLDFDFGSPTAGVMFQLPSVTRGIRNREGLHSYLLGETSEPQSIDIWAESDRDAIRNQPPGAGRLVLYPGDNEGGEFSGSAGMVDRCVDLFLRMEEEFDISLVDLSAGRSYAIDIALQATADPRMVSTTARWLVFHRWTRQHIISASHLVFGDRGILRSGRERGHDRDLLRQAIRFVRTAVVDPNSPTLAGLRAEQVVWLRDFDLELRQLASTHQIGRTTVLASIPLDPVLQWREQLITDEDVMRTQVANQATVDAFVELSERLVDDSAWEGL